MNDSFESIEDYVRRIIARPNVLPTARCPAGSSITAECSCTDEYGAQTNFAGREPVAGKTNPQEDPPMFSTHVIETVDGTLAAIKAEFRGYSKIVWQSASAHVDDEVRSAGAKAAAEADQVLEQAIKRLFAVLGPQAEEAVAKAAAPVAASIDAAAQHL